MKRIFLTAMAIPMAMALTACVHKADSAPSVQLYSASNELRATVFDAKVVAELNRLWGNKQRVLLKRRPEFGYRVELRQGDSGAVWLYAAEGYTVQATEPYGDIYQLQEHEHINRLLGITP